MQTRLQHCMVVLNSQLAKTALQFSQHWGLTPSGTTFVVFLVSSKVYGNVDPQIYSCWDHKDWDSHRSKQTGILTSTLCLDRSYIICSILECLYINYCEQRNTNKKYSQTLIRNCQDSEVHC